MEFRPVKKNLIAIIGGLFLASVFLSLALSDTNIRIYANDTNITNKALAYDDNTTHRDLTREVIAFYELSTGKKFTDEQKQWVIQGSIDEDRAPRWINHFYDPVFERGLQAESIGISGYLAKNWAQYSSYQSINPENIANLWTGKGPVISGSWWGDFSYEAAIKDYSKSKEKESYLALGHVLHLIEDMTVPEHTRNDPHPGGKDPSYYENWTSKNSSGLTQDFGKRIFNQGRKPIIYTDLESYFNNLATYTNNHFFSPRTINSGLYQKPKIVYEDGTFAYGKDENGEIFDLAIVINNKGNKSYALDDKNNQILQEYWLRLSRQAMVNGAGVIQLFLTEAEKAKEVELAKQKIDARQTAKKSSFISQIINFFSSPNAPANEPALTITSEPTKPLPKIVKQETAAKTVAVQKPAAPQTSVKPSVPTQNPPAASQNPSATTQTQTNQTASQTTQQPQTSAPVVYGGGGSTSLTTSGGGGSSGSNTSQTSQQTTTQQDNQASSTPENLNISTFQAGDLVINEIMYDLSDVADQDHEWIEIFNPRNNAVNLEGGKLYDGDGTTNSGLNAPPKNGGQGLLIIPAGGYAILAAKADIFLVDHSGFNGTVIDTVLDLKNSTDTIRLLAPDLVVIDEVTYSSSWGANGNGKTIERKSASGGSNDAANWAQSSAIGGTPGAANNWELSMSDIDNSASTTPDTATSTDNFAASTTTPVLGLGTDVPATTTITVNTTWTLADSPYRLIFNSVNHPTVAPGAVLTIEPGVKIIPQGGGYTALEIKGTLNAIATSGAPIIFTSINDADDNASTTPQKGDWLNIAFSPGAQGNLDYVEFRYGGQGNTLPLHEMVNIVGATVNIKNSKFENSQSTALHLMDSSGVVENSIFSDNNCGISVDSVNGVANVSYGGCYGIHTTGQVLSAAPQIINNQFIRNRFIGVEVRSGTAPTISGNIFTDNGYPIKIESSYPAITNSQLINSTTSPDILRGIAISGYTHFSQNYTLKKDLPYILETNGPGLMPYVDKGGTLTIEPGVIFKTGNPNSVLSMGCFNCYYPECVNCEGHLITQGTAENPVVFTSLKDDARGGDTNGDGLASSPQDRDWGNIRFNASSTGTFVNAVFSYGGYGFISPVPPPATTSAPQLLADFPTQLMWYGQPCGGGISTNYIAPDHDGFFSNVKIYNWTNRGGSSFLIYLHEAGISDFNWQIIETPSLVLQSYNNVTLDIPITAAFTAGKKYRAEVAIIGSSGTGCDYGKNTGYTASAFYELIYSPPATINPALSIDAGATVVQ